MYQRSFPFCLKKGHQIGGFTITLLFGGKNTSSIGKYGDIPLHTTLELRLTFSIPKTKVGPVLTNSHPKQSLGLFTTAPHFPYLE